MRLPQNCGPSRLLEVKLDPRYSSPLAVTWTVSLHYRTVPQTLRDVSAITGFQLEFTDRDDDDRHSVRSTFFGPAGSYSLDLSNWDFWQKRVQDAGGGDVWGPAFKRWCGSDLLWGHLVIGPQDRHVRRTLMPMGLSDDRAYYEEALRFADMFYKIHLPQRCVGVHLLFLNEWSHVALTTFFRGTWSRMYSLVFPGTDGGVDYEFTFFFFCQGPFRRFCHHAYLMDNLVMSFQPA